MIPVTRPSRDRRMQAQCGVDGDNTVWAKDNGMPHQSSADRGSGYNQTYVLLRPQQPGSLHRRALFRYGNWCYGGMVELDNQVLKLGEVPLILRTFQKQQVHMHSRYIPGSIKCVHVHAHVRPSWSTT